jgi:hypothetical protein
VTEKVSWYFNPFARILISIHPTMGNPDSEGRQIVYSLCTSDASYHWSMDHVLYGYLLASHLNIVTVDISKDNLPNCLI